MKRIQLFVAVFGLLLSQAISAQNRIISTDFNQCLEGVKDSNGTWIVPAQYYNVAYAPNNCFIVRKGEKSGLIDSNGVMLIPMIYDKLEASRIAGFYRATLNYKHGIISETRIVVPVRYASVVENMDTTFFACEKKRKWFLYRKDGTSVLVPQRSIIEPTSIANGVYLVGRKVPLFWNRYGLINDSMQTILPRRFDGISKTETSSDLFVVQNGRRAGYINSDGKWIWPMEISCDRQVRTKVRYTSRWKYFLDYDPVFYDDTVAVADRNGKKGLISTSGRVLLPFIYTKIYETYTIPLENNEKTWMVEQNGKQGIFSEYRGWIIPVQYESLNVLEFYPNAVDSSLGLLFVARQNGLYGMAMSSGQIIVPFQFTRYSDRWMNNLFYSEDSVIQVQLTSYLEQFPLPEDGSTRLAMKKSNPFPVNGHYATFKQNGLTIIYNPDQTLDTLYGKWNHEKYPTTIDDSILLRSILLIQTLSPDTIFATGHKKYSPYDGTLKHADFFIVSPEHLGLDWVMQYTQQGNYTYYETRNAFLFRSDGLVLSSSPMWYNFRELNISPELPLLFLADGKNGVMAIIDTAGNYFIAPSTRDHGPFNDQYMWINERPHRTTYNTFFPSKWKLYDRRTAQPIKNAPAVKRYRPSLRGDFFVSTTKDEGKHLHSIRSQERKPGNYNSIISLNDQYTSFMVGTCSGKIGVIDTNGRLLQDTIWNYATPANKTGYYVEMFNAADGGVTFFYDFWVLYNDTAAVYVGSNGQSLNSDSARTALVLQSMQVYSDTAKLKAKQVYNMFSEMTASNFIQLSPSDSAQLLRWQINVLGDTLGRHLNYRVGLFGQSQPDVVRLCRYCEKQTGRSWRPIPDAKNNIYPIHYVGDSILSFYASGEFTNKMWFSNVILVNRVAKNVTLDSLFDETTDWRNFVINSVLAYVNTHLNVKGDCSNPGAFPQLLNKRFLFTEKGIELYPSGFSENSRELVILLPWNEVSPYLRADVRSRLPITPQ